MPNRSRFSLGLFWAALALAAGVGILGRGYWTPDEPREADIAWRMSWQTNKAVPLLAGEAFCEKPPLTYWLAGAAIRVAGSSAWAARLPNLLYALVTALAVGALGRRGAGPIAGLAAAAAIGTFLLSYQVAIWLATDAPLLAAVAVGLLGLFVGFYARSIRERLGGYTCMHAALAFGFLSKSAAAWMVPALTLLALVIWEKRWRELSRWELHVGLLLQAAVILSWVWFVYAGPEGLAHLKVFFWNNLAGRFARIDAPEELQYAAAHLNSPGKYLIELPVYLWPWTLLVAAAVRHAWRQRRESADELRPVRFALAAFVPTLVVLSVAATARNIYLAPALPGVALLLGWWASNVSGARGRPLPDVPHRARLDHTLPLAAASPLPRIPHPSHASHLPPAAARAHLPSFAADSWDSRALRITALLLLLAALVLAAAAAIIGSDAWDALHARISFVSVSILGLLTCLGFSGIAWHAARRGRMLRGLFGLLLAYCALLVGPASQIYRVVDTWQNLGVIGRAIGRDAEGRPLILFLPDETTRAFIDRYARTSVDTILGPPTAASIQRLTAALAREPRSLVVMQLPARRDSRTLRAIANRLGLERLRPAQQDTSIDRTSAWRSLSLHSVRLYTLPNGRRYTLLETDGTPRL